MVIFSSQFLLPGCLLLPLHCPGSLLLPSQLSYAMAQSCILPAHAQLWLALLCGAVSQPQLPWFLLSATCWAPAEIFSSCCPPCLTLDAGEPLQEAHCLSPWNWSLGGLRSSWRPARPIARGRLAPAQRLLHAARPVSVGNHVSWSISVHHESCSICVHFQRPTMNHQKVLSKETVR